MKVFWHRLEKGFEMSICPFRVIKSILCNSQNPLTDNEILGTTEWIAMKLG